MNNDNKPTFKNITSCEDFKSWDGKEIQILGVIANPNDNSILDTVSMPQFSIQLIETGEKSTAYVDEIDEAFWSVEMKAVIQGQNEWFAGRFENPYVNELAAYFNYGQLIAEIKKG